jgi:hypothetical protein
MLPLRLAAAREESLEPGVLDAERGPAGSSTPACRRRTACSACAQTDAVGLRGRATGLVGGGGCGTWQRPLRPHEVARVAVRIPLEVVLVLGFSFPEWPCAGDLGDDLSRPQSRGLDVGDGFLGDTSLLFVEVEDRGTVARTDVVALTVQRRRIVYPEEEL